MHIGQAFRNLAARKITVFDQLEDDVSWKSAGQIFDPIARALIDLGADRNVKRRVLGPLIEMLQEGDWDTEDESLEQFRHDVDIVALFAEHGVGSRLRGGDNDGMLTYVLDEWTLFCEQHGRLDGGPGSAAVHDRLLRTWDAHDVAEHHGRGGSMDHLLIDQEATAQ